MTALPSPSLASIVALMFRWAVNCCWKIVPPTEFVQSVATLSATSVRPLLVVPAANGVSVFPHTTWL